jgi:hypothetical protein
MALFMLNEEGAVPDPFGLEPQVLIVYKLPVALA